MGSRPNITPPFVIATFEIGPVGEDNDLPLSEENEHDQISYNDGEPIENESQNPESPSPSPSNNPTSPASSMKVSESLSILLILFLFYNLYMW